TPGLPTPAGQSVAGLEGRLAGLVGLVWKDLLETNATIRVLNDAQAALVGEAWKGAAAGYREVVLLTLGTGVGGGILSEGRLVRGAIGRAGHVGPLSPDPEGPPPATTPAPRALGTRNGDSPVP